MKNKIITVAAWTVGIFIGLTISGVVIGAVASRTNPAPTDAAVYNTTMNSFVSACKGQPNTSQTSCSCAWYKLDDYYKQQGNAKWYTDTALVNRITTQGYNQAETDAFTTCFE